MLSGRPLARAADTADRFRRLLEWLLAELESYEPEAAVEALETLLHGLNRGDFDVPDLIQREREYLREILDSCCSLQIAIDACRDDPTWRDF